MASSDHLYQYFYFVCYTNMLDIQLNKTQNRYTCSSYVVLILCSKTQQWNILVVWDKIVAVQTNIILIYHHKFKFKRNIKKDHNRKCAYFIVFSSCFLTTWKKRTWCLQRENTERHKLLVTLIFWFFSYQLHLKTFPYLNKIKNKI